jgi:hypothetical protein
MNTLLVDSIQRVVLVFHLVQFCLLNQGLNILCDRWGHSFEPVYLLEWQSEKSCSFIKITVHAFDLWDFPGANKCSNMLVIHLARLSVLRQLDSGGRILLAEVLPLEPLDVLRLERVEFLPSLLRGVVNSILL